MGYPEPEKPYDEGFIDPVYEALKLRAEASDEAHEATKHHANCMALRHKISVLELKKAKLEEEKSRLTERSKLYWAQANHHKKELDNNHVLAEELASEMNRKEDKATTLKRKSAALDAKIERISEKTKQLEEDAEKEQRLKDEHMEQSRQLEIQAMGYEKR